MCLMVEKCQSNGQLQKPWPIRSTPQPVMYGAMVVFSMRYGASGTSLSQEYLTEM